MNKKPISRGELIRLGAAVGLGSAGASLVAACGGGRRAENGGSPTATAASSTAGGGAVGAGPEVGKGQAIAKESELEPGSAFSFTDADTGDPGVLVRLESGEFVAYSALCTHQVCTVAYRVETRRLACPCHGAIFDPAKGADVETGPAQAPLSPIKVEAKGGEIVKA